MPFLADHATPASVGLPDRFPSFRSIQREMLEYALVGPDPDALGPRRVHALGAPAGSGKSVGAHLIGRMSGVKYVVLTATRALEDQYVKDGFDCAHVQGRANYTCHDHDPLHPDETWTCEDGYGDKDCNLCDTTMCAYGAAVDGAKRHRAVLTNYQYWMHARCRNRGALESKKEPIGLLILDEFHKAGNELSRFLGVWIGNDELHKWADQEVRAVVRSTHGAEWGRVGADWIGALDSAYIRMLTRMAQIEEEYVDLDAPTPTDPARVAYRQSREYRRLSKLTDNIERVVSLGQDNNWIWRVTKSGISFDCIWPGRYAERYLFSGVPRVVCMSATLRPKALAMVGLKSADYWFKEWRPVFPPSNTPIYWIPTGRMGRRSTEADWQAAVARADEIYAEWGHLKGIVHTPSYKLAERLQAACKFGRHMILSEPGKQVEAAERYRKAKAPAILVSPSFMEGWNFPDEQCDWIHIPKLPFGDRSDPVLLARVQSDERYDDYETMQKLVQACYRGTRHEEDRCTVMITDDAVRNFRNYAREHAPKSFKVRDAEGVPRAPRRET